MKKHELLFHLEQNENGMLNCQENKKIDQNLFKLKKINEMVIPFTWTSKHIGESKNSLYF